MRITFADMGRGADAQILSTEIFENCGNYWIVEDYLLLMWMKTIKIMKISPKIPNILHIYSLLTMILAII